MHECPLCQEACDCDGEDIWNDAAAAACTCNCEADWEEDPELDYDEIERVWLSQKVAPQPRKPIVDRSGLDNAARIFNHLHHLMQCQCLELWAWESPWPGWLWALENARDSHHARPWAKPDEDMPF